MARAWSLLSVTTGNTSIVERISIIKAMPKAEAQRILECRVKRIHFETKEETDKFSACYARRTTATLALSM